MKIELNQIYGRIRFRKTYRDREMEQEANGGRASGRKLLRKKVEQEGKGKGRKTSRWKLEADSDIQNNGITAGGQDRRPEIIDRTERRIRDTYKIKECNGHLQAYMKRQVSK